MPVIVPALDDRGFEDLVQELVARIPAHAPEWTNPRVGDPGYTIVELFAWLADTLLYRANLIPERQRLAFLRLLGLPLRSATPARSVVSILYDEREFTGSATLAPLTSIKAAVPFETRSEVTLLPVTGEPFYKRPLTTDEQRELASVVDGLRTVYTLDRAPRPYVTTPVFAGGAAQPGGWDMVSATIDSALWIALLAPDPALVPAVRTTLGRGADGGSRLLSIGFAPAIEVPPLFEEIGSRGRIAFVCEISTGREVAGRPEYLPLPVVNDTTTGLRKQGVIRVALPSEPQIGAPSNNVRAALNAGTGDRPPRIDDPEVADRIVTWVRLRPKTRLASMPVSWVGINAVEIDGRRTVAGQIAAVSDGNADQVVRLPGQSVERETLQIEVEEVNRGYVPWTLIDDLALAGRDDAVYSLDPEAGEIRFGDGIRGRVADREARIRIALMRSGGGAAGNVPPGTLTAINAARDVAGNLIAERLRVVQSLPTLGGDDAESIEAAEQRIPGVFRNRDRAVTEDDYRTLAAQTPGVRLGRVEVLPKFKPHQRRLNQLGVVSVMVLPAQAGLTAPNPRPDRPTLEAVHEYLSARCPLTTELYVIACEYIPIAVSVGVEISDGAERDTVLNNVRQAVKAYLWPLVPGGPDGVGWPLGRTIRDREIEVAVARVPGVSEVSGVNLFTRRGDAWQMLARLENAQMTMPLAPWQLPELLAVVAEEGDAPVSVETPATTDGGIAVPVVPEVC